MSRVIQWDREKLKALKAALGDPRQNTKGQITVELPGEKQPVELVRGYAAYLVEYLEGEFGRNPDQPRQPYNEGEEGQ